MKASLEFNLPEETHEHLCAVHAMDMYLVISDILGAFRSKLKYGELTDEQYEAVEKLRDEVLKLVDEYGLTQIVNK